jgi:tetratricopeptide (TPR) repeat protein
LEYNGPSKDELIGMKAPPDLQPAEIEVHRAAARSLAHSLQFAEAITAWQRVESLVPGDPEAAEAIARLIVDQSRQRMGLATHATPPAPVIPEAAGSPAGNGQPATRAAASAATRPAVLPGSDFRRTPIQELEIAIREFPSNAEYYLQLVPLYLEKGREYDAERLLDKGREATANDPRVCRQWEDVTMQRMEKRLAVAEKHAQSESSEQAQKELDECRRERDQLETNIFASRCKREPRNAAARIELARRLKRGGKIHDACQRLEEALSDPDHKSGAAVELGRCHQELGEPDEALRYFRLAADSATRPAHLEAKKQALYAAGQLAASLNLRRLARRYLSDLLHLDPAHRDAAALVASFDQAGPSSNAASTQPT